MISTNSAKLLILHITRGPTFDPVKNVKEVVT